MFHADHELQHLQKTVLFLFKPEGEKPSNCAAANCRPLCRNREKNLRYNGVKTSSQCSSLWKMASCVCPTRHMKEKCGEMCAHCGERNTFP
ncbi:hypothetical protein TNCV_1383951 [Trichonephila clavipes]|nr:hypothetical protein TNCV_1383951 [Trichonephila clavipes]